MSDAISILIVDDEPVARSRLRELLADLAPDFTHRIVGEAANAPEALSQIDLYQPQVVLLDVQMPGMTGIELARHVSARAASSETPRAMPLVIFVTAFEEFAVDAFEVRAIDYLLKPVRAQRLLDALKRAVTRLPSDQIEAIDQLARATNTRRRHLSVHERGRVILVPLEQVIYLKAELKYITVRTREREFLIEESLTSKRSSSTASCASIATRWSPGPRSPVSSASRPPARTMRGIPTGRWFCATLPSVCRSAVASGPPSRIW
jgi:two-component system response regulator AlgR